MKSFFFNRFSQTILSFFKKKFWPKIFKVEKKYFSLSKKKKKKLFQKNSENFWTNISIQKFIKFWEGIFLLTFCESSLWLFNKKKTLENFFPKKKIWIIRLRNKKRNLKKKFLKMYWGKNDFSHNYIFFQTIHILFLNFKENERVIFELEVLKQKALLLRSQLNTS